MEAHVIIDIESGIPQARITIQRYHVFQETGIASQRQTRDISTFLCLDVGRSSRLELLTTADRVILQRSILLADGCRLTIGTYSNRTAGTMCLIIFISSACYLLCLLGQITVLPRRRSRKPSGGLAS